MIFDLLSDFFFDISVSLPLPIILLFFAWKIDLFAPPPLDLDYSQKTPLLLSILRRAMMRNAHDMCE